MIGTDLSSIKQGDEPSTSFLIQLVGWVLPALTLLIGLILDAVPFATGGWAVAIPSFFLPILFYWSVQLPDRVPLLLVCALGFAADMIHSVPLGVHALSYMVVALGSKSQSGQLASLGILFNWVCFAFALVSFGALKFFLSILGTAGIFQNSLLPAVLQSLQLALTTIAAYAAFHLVLGGLKRLFLPAKPNEV